jgi:hypothetical protein
LEKNTELYISLDLLYVLVILIFICIHKNLNSPKISPYFFYLVITYLFTLAIMAASSCDVPLPLEDGSDWITASSL